VYWLKPTKLPKAFEKHSGDEQTKDSIHVLLTVKTPTRCKEFIKILLFIILNEAQHVSGHTPPIIRNLKLHKQPLFFYTWNVVGRAVVGRCQVAHTTWQRPTTARPTTFHLYKTRDCVCNFRLLMMGDVSPETCWTSFKIRNNKILIQRLSWFGYVQRMLNTRTVKKIFNWKPLSKRSQGRPKYRWEDNIKQDICQMKIQNWIACVQDRGKWKEVIEKAKTFN